jgi:hypothetical protein
MVTICTTSAVEMAAPVPEIKDTPLALSTQLRHGFPGGLFSSGFPINIILNPIYVCYMSFHPFLLDFIILRIFSEEYSHEAPATSSSSVQNILLSILSQTPSVYVSLAVPETNSQANAESQAKLVLYF